MNDFNKISFSELSALGVSSDDLPIFCRSAWFDQIQKVWPEFAVEVYIYQKKFLVFVVCNSKGGRQGLPLTDVGGVFPLVAGEKLDLSVFSIAWKQNFPTRAQVSLNSAYLEVSADSNVETDLYDYRLDLQELAQASEPLSRVRKTLRHILQTPSKFSVSSFDAQDAKMLYKLYLQNLRQKATLALPYELFHALLSDSATECLVAKSEGKIIGFSLFINYPDYSHYFLSAVRPQYRQLQVAHYLLWHQIQSAMQAGKKYFLLGGTRKNGPLAVFKQGWGGEECPIYTIHSDPTHGSSSLRTSRWRSLWRLVPLQLIPHLSKFWWSRIV